MCAVRAACCRSNANIDLAAVTAHLWWLHLLLLIWVRWLSLLKGASLSVGWHISFKSVTAFKGIYCLSCLLQVKRQA
jgi:hypothetical protein